MMMPFSKKLVYTGITIRWRAQTNIKKDCSNLISVLLKR